MTITSLDFDEIPLEDTDNYLYISDFYCAAALTACGHKIVHIDKGTKKSVFIFKRNKEILKTLEDYWSNELVINAQTHTNHIRSLKTRLYS